MPLQPGRTLSSRWLSRAFCLDRCTTTSTLAAKLPLYLCPAFRPVSNLSGSPRHHHHTVPSIQCRRLHTEPNPEAHTETHTPIEPLHAEKEPIRTLPVQCTGCGALSHTTIPEQAGYFDLSRNAVKEYLGLVGPPEKRKVVKSSDQVIEDALKNVNMEELERMGIDLKSLLPKDYEANKKKETEGPPHPPLCDRCHQLIHHRKGNSIFHPGIDSLRETIEESPYKYNHVYHVVDAADFPMSLIPKLERLVGTLPIRSKNRRAKSETWHAGRQINLSFIITRSDLLAPKKEQVDRLKPYLVETLRKALGRIGNRVRLGNVMCVSARRNWWTKELKEEIFEHGGANWMVGRVNVGKSRLFHDIFPQGRMNWQDNTKLPLIPALRNANVQYGKLDEGEDALLPPAQPETDYPAMPIVSDLPGTTASPVRVPFGNKKGELIDLPGLSRGDLELYVKPEKRTDLVMKLRVVPEQETIKPGQSLLIGGFIRITPKTPDLTFLAYSFTPIEAHVTGTDKAILVQEMKEGAPNVENIALPETAEKIKHAGSFALKYDVTKQRAGPLTRKNACGFKVDSLPFRVLSIDILIEGVGWVEIVAQVRAKSLQYNPMVDEQADKEEEATETEEKKEEYWTDPLPSSKKKAAAFQDPFRLDGLDLSDPNEEPKPKPKPKPKPEEDPLAPPRIREAEVVEEIEETEEEYNKRRKKEEEQEEIQLNWPVIDVYSPEGRFIGSRPPMGAWLLNAPKSDGKKRPRKAMKGVKKEQKRRAREMAAAAGGQYRRNSTNW
ncbi:hypothetical protein B0T20DRAFT_415469 [Sordaria brevicollis]|uniref:Genetic interactor of prohibitins 3, mitochondrial n=1 Tax=Sordaria brevicollis TaxID=83679 RepID=A0AAE0PC52_SORBR|nr:hypothetical protein B0T20DRAFT_415469 [Sordaria brevicollis]